MGLIDEDLQAHRDHRLQEELKKFSDRMSETIACLRDWHIMNRIGLFDKGQVPVEMQELVDKAVKNTRRVLTEWKAIEEEPDASLQSGGDKP